MFLANVAMTKFSYFIKLLQWIILCNTFYTHPHSVSGFMPQFVTKSAYCTGFPCGQIQRFLLIQFYFHLSNLKYKQCTLLVDVRNWLSSTIFNILTIFTHILSRYFIFLVNPLTVAHLYLSRFRVS